MKNSQTLQNDISSVGAFDVESTKTFPELLKTTTVSKVAKTATTTALSEMNSTYRTTTSSKLMASLFQSPAWISSSTERLGATILSNSTLPSLYSEKSSHKQPSKSMNTYVSLATTKIVSVETNHTVSPSALSKLSLHITSPSPEENYSTLGTTKRSEPFAFTIQPSATTRNCTIRYLSMTTGKRSPLAKVDNTLPSSTSIQPKDSIHSSEAFIQPTSTWATRSSKENFYHKATYSIPGTHVQPSPKNSLLGTHANFVSSAIFSKTSGVQRAYATSSTLSIFLSPNFPVLPISTVFANTLLSSKTFTLSSLHRVSPNLGNSSSRTTAIHLPATSSSCAMSYHSNTSAILSESTSKVLNSSYTPTGMKIITSSFSISLDYSNSTTIKVNVSSSFSFFKEKPSFSIFSSDTILRPPNVSFITPTRSVNQTLTNELRNYSKLTTTAFRTTTRMAQSTVLLNSIFIEFNGKLVVSLNSLRRKDENDFNELSRSLEDILDEAITPVDGYLYTKVLTIKTRDYNDLYESTFECVFKVFIRKPSSETAASLERKIIKHNETGGFGRFVLFSVEISFLNMENESVTKERLYLWAIIVIAVLGVLCLLCFGAFIGALVSNSVCFYVYIIINSLYINILFHR